MRVLIVGGAGGIGSAISRICAEHGMWPIICYSQNEDNALKTLQKCRVGEILRLNLLHEDFDIDKELPQADALIHCAGKAASVQTLLESSEDEILKQMTLHALGPLRLTQALAKKSHDLRNVIFVLSTAISSQRGGPYALSKTAGFSICKLIATEFIGHGIQVDAIVPGWTETPMALDAARVSGRKLEDIRSEHLDGKLLSPDDIGFLCKKLLIDSGTESNGRLIFWDRRISREPIWHSLDSIFNLEQEVYCEPK